LKIGLVLEGGAMRGVYTAGVLESFMAHDLYVDEVVGVSAGASNGVSFVSRQKGRCRRCNIEYAGDKRYLSIGNYFKTGSLFGMDFLFRDLPERLDPFDYQTFHTADCAYFAGATDIETGKAVFFGKEHIQPDSPVLPASCSMPMLAGIVSYRGHQYLDGGVTAPIPVQKALDDGCDRLVIVLTRPRDYRKQAQKGMGIVGMYYRKYPLLVQAMRNRHIVYNQTLEQIRQLEATGQAVVIAPRQALALGRFEQDKQVLTAAFEQGYADAVSALTAVDAWRK